MNIIEQATKRLEQLERAGVSVPWGAAGVTLRGAGVDGDIRHPLADGTPVRMPLETTPELAIRQQEAMRVSSLPVTPAALDRPDPVQEAQTVMLDLEGLEQSGHLVPSQVRSTLAEEFRHIKRPLLRNARSKESVENRLSLIMVTSALPKEGKTFCAINLAMSMSIEVDTSVLLVDADVVRPEVLHRLGVDPQKKGLLDLLTDPQLRLSDVVLKTNVPKLSILPAGTRNNMSTELLASEAMGALLVSLAESNPNRIVIFDAPPLLVTTEAKVLASRLGQVVMVVESSGTPRRVAMQAFAAVEQCPIVMSVMNKANEPAGPGYGDYYG